MRSSNVWISERGDIMDAAICALSCSYSLHFTADTNDVFFTKIHSDASIDLNKKERARPCTVELWL